jgi:hypothetical protein
MRAAVTILLASVAAFLAAKIPLWIFFPDVKPVAWGEEAQSSERLQAAFLLLTVENLAVVGVVIALAAILTLWTCPYATKVARNSEQTQKL